jgi:predicted O-methyltransferase YrrM
MSNLSRKIIAGGPSRKTRLHDGNDVLIPFGRLVRNGPRAIATGIGRLAFGWRPVRPWISYDAQHVLDTYLKPSMRVLEFGSGMSTAWYAKRVREVVAIEDYRVWFDKIQMIFTARGIANVKYRFAADETAYLSLSDEDRGNGFDFVMIDGSHRHRCVDVAIANIRPGGIIYLDNSDKGAEGYPTGNCIEARERLVAWAREMGTQPEFFTDFAPTQLFVQSGLLVRAAG